VCACACACACACVCVCEREREREREREGKRVGGDIAFAIDSAIVSDTVPSPSSLPRKPRSPQRPLIAAHCVSQTPVRC
jgi:hypothetical protein